MLTCATDKRLCSSQNSGVLEYHCDIIIKGGGYIHK